MLYSRLKSRQQWRFAILLRVALALVTLAPRVVVAAGNPAGGDAKARADSLYKEGLELYKREEFERAATALSRSYELSDSTETLFAWAQAQRMAGHCVDAVNLFERFIARSPPPRQIEAARLAMRRCSEAAKASTPQGEVSPQSLVVRNPTPEASWYVDPAGGALCAAGLTSAIIGLALVVSAHGRAGVAEAAPTLEEAENIRAQAESRWAWGVGLSLLGLAGIGGGIARYVSVSRSQHEASLALGGRF